jgi:hypothetical protein
MRQTSIPDIETSKLYINLTLSTTPLLGRTLMETGAAAERRSWWTLIGAGALWVLAYFGSRAALEMLQLQPGERVIVALLPLLPFAWFLWHVVSGIRSMDELERRVHLEALGIAFPLAVLLLMTLGLVQLAVDLNPEDWSYRHVWIYLPIFYFLGLVISWRRYR